MTSDRKQEYRRPLLANYGSITKLTQGGGSISDGGGSGGVAGVMVMLMAELPTSE